MASIVVKKSANPRSVTSQLQRTKLSDMTDASFGTLDASSDGKFVSYDESIKKFTLVSADDLLVVSIEDDDLPDEFFSAANEIKKAVNTCKKLYFLLFTLVLFS